MTDKIYFTQNDEEIIDYITDAGHKHDDDETHRVTTFFHNNSYHLILFFATPGDKGFIMFKIDDIKDNLSELKNLKLILIEFLKAGDNKAIIKDAIAQVELIEAAGKAADIFNMSNTKVNPK